MSSHREQMNSNLIEEDDCRGPGLPYSVFQNSGKHGKRFCQEPFKVATGCLTGLCLLLLLILLVTGLHTGKAPPSGAVSPSSAPETHMQKGCVNVTGLTAELQAVKKQKDDLEKEHTKLRERITKLEAESAPHIPPVPTQSPCPENWKYFNGSCYFISVYSRSWAGSQSFCKKEGGHLAIILTAEEQTFIWDLLPRGYWNAYWFGITDEKVEEEWHWVDGTKLVGGFWEDGEPNNHINEDCGYMIKTDVLTRVATKSWYDAPCFMSLPWICEKTASS